MSPCFLPQLERGDFLSEEWRERIANTRYGCGLCRWPAGTPGSTPPCPSPAGPAHAPLRARLSRHGLWHRPSARLLGRKTSPCACSAPELQPGLRGAAIGSVTVLAMLVHSAFRGLPGNISGHPGSCRHGSNPGPSSRAQQRLPMARSRRLSRGACGQCLAVAAAARCPRWDSALTSCGAWPH